MYKLLLVSDQEDVLNAFAQVSNWEMHGFKAPHIRHDFEGAVDSLGKHHADGICIALSDPAEEEKVLAYLQEHFPDVSIFEAGRTEEEVLRYLSELKILLNRLHADFYNERFNTTDVLQICRHEFFRKLMNGKVRNSDDLHRNMRLLRSRMDADRPCLLIEIEQTAPYDQLEGRWHYGTDRLEMALRNSFAGDKNGIHILPDPGAGLSAARGGNAADGERHDSHADSLYRREYRTYEGILRGGHAYCRYPRIAGTEFAVL